MSRGLILLAHGARDPAWAGPFEAVVARMRERAPGAPRPEWGRPFRI